MFCNVCGTLDEKDDEPIHNISIRHICNSVLAEYKNVKRQLGSNRDGIIIQGKAEVLGTDGKYTTGIELTDARKIRINVKPGQEVKFIFNIRNDMEKEDIEIVGIQLGHPQPEFVMSEHPYIFGEQRKTLTKKSAVKEEVSVSFRPADIGQYEMPIMYTFLKKIRVPKNNQDEKNKQTVRNLIIVRDMVVVVEENPMALKFPKTPYSKEPLERAEFLVPSSRTPTPPGHKIPPVLKILFARGLEEKALEGVKPMERKDQLRVALVDARAIIDTGITMDNYVNFFHYLLWWEEVIAKINLRRYNMTNVALELRLDRDRGCEMFVLEVPGLAEKRPSLLRNDRVYLQPVVGPSRIFECVIKNIEDNYIHLADLDPSFFQQHVLDSRYNVRFIMSRVPFERAHEAIAAVFSAGHAPRLFPGGEAPPRHPRQPRPPPPRIQRFWNGSISQNAEQRSAVEHILAGTSGKAPYIVFGPPGTGKTMTIVEAIIQLVVQNSKNRVLVCTDSNMAADHIALMLLRYSSVLNIPQFLLRANSQTREWGTMPAELAVVSNGNSYNTFYSVDNATVSQFRIVVTTLMHAAKYSMPRSQKEHRLEMTHLFVDEAAQASEPHTLVPIAGLLARSGQLVLAGDPKQLGPVCMSRGAKEKGLGQSLLERLTKTCPLYSLNPNYITMLRNNFRNHADILRLPNELFYNDELVPLAPKDPLSCTSVLGLPGGECAVVFHALHSKEQRMGNAPSYFNEKELDMLQRYVSALVTKHGVMPSDIGVIAPYIRQVYKMKAWLVAQGYGKIEVGTVEAFQGKEKRVILVSTVRANCGLLDYDAKYGLGFLVDDKRFNVAITRAKAKLIIVGNPTCLTRDEKWRRFMALCSDLGCYHGRANQQMDRTQELLNEIAKTRFDKCRITDVLRNKKEQESVNRKVQKPRYRPFPM